MHGSPVLFIRHAGPWDVWVLALKLALEGVLVVPIHERNPQTHIHLHRLFLTLIEQKEVIAPQVDIRSLTFKKLILLPQHTDIDIAGREHLNIAARGIYEHDIERLSQQRGSQVLTMHFETCRFAFTKGKPPVLHQLTVQDQGRKVQKADCDCRSEHIEEIFGEGQLVHEKLELEEVLSWLANRLLHGVL